MEYRTSLKKRLALNDKDTFAISTLRYLGLKYIRGGGGGTIREFRSVKSTFFVDIENLRAN